MKTPGTFNFVPAAKIRSELGLSKAVQARLRKHLPTPIYWTQVPYGRSILWNYRLLRDALLNGTETPSHRQLVEQFVQTLKK